MVRLKLHELFINWLTIPETQEQITNMLTAVDSHQIVSSVGNLSLSKLQISGEGSSSGEIVVGKHPNETFLSVPMDISKKVSPPPRSPSSLKNSNNAFDFVDSPGLTQKRNFTLLEQSRNLSSVLDFDMKDLELTDSSSRRQSATIFNNKIEIPQFYFPKKQPSNNSDVPADEFEEQMSKIHNFFAISPEGFTAADFVGATREICGLPSFLNTTLFQRVLQYNKHLQVTQNSSNLAHTYAGDTDDEDDLVKEYMFIRFWKDFIVGRDDTHKLFNVFKDFNKDYIVNSDFKLFLQDLLDNHPGLDFLKETPAFQEKYAETVIVRIFYTVNRSMNRRISFEEFSKSNLVETIKLLDQEDDINLVHDYFSYEHFYVLYCKFWELDTDHDFIIDESDLQKYGSYSLTNRIISRIFAGAPRKLSSCQQKKMNYEDFIWFCLSEEDKNSETGVDYWFRCVDLDNDGFISGFEMEYFYTEQLARMESISQDTIQFSDIICQLVDMVKPRDPKRITTKDLKKSKMASIFFNVLFNLNKFVAYEQRDPFQVKQERSGPEKTDWERFARIEYDRMAMEDESNEDMGDYNGWDAHEAPF